jgi:Bacterial aa3 type cytochrome c oxidase subunit IV
MDHHTPADVDPAALENSRKIWHGFTAMVKYNLIAIIALLIGMAIFLV